MKKKHLVTAQGKEMYSLGDLTRVEKLLERNLLERVKCHHELAIQFVINMENNVVHLAGINFTLSPAIIAEATKMPDVGEKWNKRQNISKQHYEPYIKSKYHGKLHRVFPFKFLEDQYVPLMKLIIKYFT